ncbi:uncharacterized protein LOC133803875 [Humulus lupulus]|uniref:uncharacterized protein LOC133803875 n=1 Tax=Humulus lupulus TaxID=3486 RepID=UPI002B4044BD|nr:uncharacterized protein LOC133803875 [Humulus lupulus]
MELRSCNHFHFIKAAGGDLVPNTLNVNLGRPVFKVKTLEDIFDTLDAKDQNLILQPKVKLDGLLSDSSGIKVDGPSTCTLAKRVLISDPDTSEFNCSDDDDGSNSDVDDLGFGEMTLKQIKENCKAKKRKRSKYVHSITDERCTRFKLQTDEEECDLMETLITMKSKVSKKAKAKEKGKCRQNLVSSSSQISASNTKVEQISSDIDVIQSKGSFPAPITVKVEVPEVESLESQSSILFSSDSSLLYDDQVDSCEVVQREVTKIATDYDLCIQALCSDGQNAICFSVDSCGVVHKKMIEITGECDPDFVALRSESQNATCSFGDSSLIYDSEGDTCEVETEIAFDCDRGTQKLIYVTGKPQDSIVSEGYHEYSKHSIPEPLQTLDNSVYSCVVVPKKITEPATECVPGTQMLIFPTEESEYCVQNEACFDYMENDNPKPVQNPSASCDDIKRADILEISSQLCSELPVLESKGEGYVNQLVCANIFREPVLSTSDCRHDVLDDIPSPSSNHVIPCNVDSNANDQLPSVVHGCLQYTEYANESEANVQNEDNIDDSIHNLQTSPDSWVAPSVDDSPTNDDKQSEDTIDDSIHNLKTSPDSWVAPSIDDSPTNDEKQSEELVISEGGEPYYQDSKLNCPPQRLLSTRKVISPDSQEKLCQAVESIELRVEEHYRPKKKLCFTQQTEKKTKISKAERSGQVARVRFSANHKQSAVKPKNEGRLTQPEGDHKGPHHSNVSPRFSTGCTSIETCSQNAIAFSQRQMQDMECLATKLTNELKTMKNFVEDRLLPEACPATSLKYKPSELRMAIKNANRAEQLAQRWLSIMARDCNRFCKIMRLTENESGAPERETVVNKEKKKITFADEAGEELCHIRHFENESSLEPNTHDLVNK